MSTAGSLRMSRRPTSGSPPAAADSDAVVLRKYYSDSDIFMSTEGILKVLSVVTCVACGALAAWGGAGRAAGGGAAVALACAVLAACLYAGAVTPLAARAPALWLYLDIIASTVMGILLLVAAVLAITCCDPRTVAAYLYGLFAVVSAGMITASGALTYASVMRQLDAVLRPPQGPRTSPPTELEV